MPLVLDWRNAPSTDELVKTIVERLASGELVALPTEVGYIVVSSVPTEGLRRLLAFPSQTPPQIACLIPEDARPWIRRSAPSLERLMRRLWPGPVSFEVAIPAAERVHFSPELQEGLIQQDRLRFASFAHSAFQSLLFASEFSLAFREVSLAAGETILARVGDQVDVVVDGGEIVTRAMTALEITENSCTILRDGVVRSEEILRAQGRWILFICTGNTCRSPMAEAICKARLAERVGGTIAELASKGYNVLSSGVAAQPGDGAARDAQLAVQSFGGDLSEHRSQPATDRLILQADHLIAMTRGHLMAVLSRFSPPGTMSLLCGAEGDLEDPIGGGPQVYQECAATIHRHVDRLISELKLI